MAHATELSGAVDDSATGFESGDEGIKVLEGEEAIAIHVGTAAGGDILAGVIELDPADVLDPVAMVSRNRHSMARPPQRRIRAVRW